MKKRVQLKDIAEKAKVSTSLVSFVLNGKAEQYRIGEEISKKILEIAREMDYHPNMAAKSLRSGKSKTIGVIVTDISNPFFSAIARVIEDFAAIQGYTVIFGSTDEDCVKLKKCIDVFLNKGVDGLIIVPCEDSLPLIEELMVNKVPVVLLDRHFSALKCNYICLNNFKASYDATQHLIDEGYKHIVMVAYHSAMVHMQDRIRGYECAMSENGLSADKHVYTVHYNAVHQEVDTVLNNIFNSNTGVDALIFATNTLSIGGLYYINKSQIRIPGDLGVIGFDGGDAFNFFYAPVTYISQPVQELATESVRLLIDIIERKNNKIQQLELGAELIIQQSSRRNS